ncbi:hypothetical protein [Psychrobacter sp. 16-MNA-CIBAN-0192]|uniref:hypothetical protein n=1 Tax=Psychrobacter sp. 16-MNA-CIBAN-0192 TaxID=3140448 RepID=UPI0033347361
MKAVFEKIATFVLGLIFLWLLFMFLGWVWDHKGAIFLLLVGIVAIGVVILLFSKKDSSIIDETKEQINIDEEQALIPEIKLDKVIHEEQALTPEVNLDKLEIGMDESTHILQMYSSAIDLKLKGEYNQAYILLKQYCELLDDPSSDLFKTLAEFAYLAGKFDDSAINWVNCITCSIVDYIESLPESGIIDNGIPNEMASLFGMPTQTPHTKQKLDDLAYREELVSKFFSKCIHLGNAYIAAKADIGARDAVVNLIMSNDSSLTSSDAVKIFDHDAACYRARLISKEANQQPPNVGIKSCSLNFNDLYFNQGKNSALEYVHWDYMMKM